jgi:hypothetical protein
MYKKHYIVFLLLPFILTKVTILFFVIFTGVSNALVKGWQCGS